MQRFIPRLLTLGKSSLDPRASVRRVPRAHSWLITPLASCALALASPSGAIAEPEPPPAEQSSQTVLGNHDSSLEPPAADSAREPNAAAGDTAPESSTDDSPEPAREAPDLEEITVTGSRLDRSNFTATGPITTLSAEDLELTGSTSVADLLEDVPSVDFSGTNEVQTNGGRGRSTVGLRGLGAGRVLVLLNGRRFVSSSSGAADAVDLGNLPPQLIADIEILRDGVSTIYGADAVAGVINFRTRQSFEGFEVNAFGGASEERDGGLGELSFVWGRNFEAGNITLYGNIGAVEPVNSQDRSFSRSPLIAARIDPATGQLVETRDFFSIPQGALAIRNRTDPSDPTDVVGFDAAPDGRSFSPFSTEANGRNINDTIFITGEQYRSSLNGSMTFEVLPSVVGFAEATYTRRDSKAGFSPSFLGGGGTIVNPDGFTFGLFRPDSPFAVRNNPFLPRDFLDFFFEESGLISFPDGSPVPIGLVDQTFPDGVPLTLFRGFDEFGPRVFQSEVRTLRTVFGLRGELPFLLEDLDWETTLNYGRSDDTESVENDINFSNALASVRPDVCAQTPGCAVGNFFGTNSLLTTPEAFNFIRIKPTDRLKFHLMQFVAQARTTVARLPAGDLRLAAGVEFREEDGSVSVDPVTLAGDSAGLSREGTRGRQLVREAFFEAEIPLIEDLPAIESLGINVSGRYTDYSSFGGRYLSRYTVNYSPSQDFRIRGVYATSFRSPTISDLFLGSAESFVLVNDRCRGFPNLPEPLRTRCAQQLPDPDSFSPTDPFDSADTVGQRQTRTNIGGNPLLQEETARNLSLGFVYSPDWLSGAQLAADYFDIDVDNPIVGQNPQFRLDNCLLRQIDSECSALRRGADGVLSFVDSPRTNFGALRTNGIDFSLRYATELPLLGLAEFDLEGVYTFDFEVDSFAGRGKANGTIGVTGGSLPNMKGFLRVRVSPTPNLQIFMSTQYIGEADIPARNGLPFDNVPDVIYLNVGISYEIDERYAIGLSIQNATDKQPPLIVNGDNNTNRSFDQIGRSATVSFRARF